MNTKTIALASAIGGVAALLAPFAHADGAMITVPATFGTEFLANVGTQFTDPGTLLVLTIVVGLPLTFWVAKRLIGLVPKGK